MNELTLPAKILALHARLGDARIHHAFGGALALAYYAVPRPTTDVNVNVFLAPARASQVYDALAPLGVDVRPDRSTVERDGQARVMWGRTPLDLFFAYDPIHAAMQRAARTVPFGEERIVVLGPEHLVVCKAVFDRPKDWLDIEQVLVCVDDLDGDEIEQWLERIVGRDDTRFERFVALRRRN
ncbi:hypothetical protein [Conexibacter woesei]|uniref:Uncharacterized protein n=1 Tax=Conexibacter woesei (strain DSM 14684 / CCUG 47730 / CIP 108061 / JCM 11494 / NBRC 100937 / ID131577) TaxID=469383 RepID=D3FC52_CONWI|nr:hypothetical protein [Conexibacter woesei]ADB53347.1 hypothetical protein Cwoe_4936 [Conexibacter woesei DSM 14684]